MTGTADTLDIPDFLKRNADGSLMYPKARPGEPAADDYDTFLMKKMARAEPCGIKAGDLPRGIKAFQRDIVDWSLGMGRAAIFAGTGLGKTLQQLSWGDAIAGETKRPVLALTPLAVAQQTVREAEKFNIDGVAYAADQSEANSRIVVTNYDRIEKFDPSKFSGIILDESSIIKAHDSKTRARLIEFSRYIPFRLPCTATPAPNDYVELGNHAEFLGVCTAKEMLATWFVHDGSIRATNAQNKGAKPIADWRLKRHAERDFWAWVASWAVIIRHPRDLGYDEPGYDLPPLYKHQVTVPVPYEPDFDTGMLFPMMAQTLSERLGARRSSVQDRVRRAAEIVNDQRDRPWLIWCQLNDEADALKAEIPWAIEVRGSDDRDQKAERLLGFAEGRYPALISKPSIAGWGMNFQHCADMTFVGLNDSFEQLFQALRRCWRFGQTKPVNAWMIASELEGAVVANLEDKEREHEAMADAMAEHMRDLCTRSLRGRVANTITPHTKPMSVPQWLTAA